MKNIPFTSARICSRIWDYIKSIKVDGKQRSVFWKCADVITLYLGIKVELRIFRKVSMVRWLKPPIGWVKLNTDGAARAKPCLAAAGGLFVTIWGIRCFVLGNSSGSILILLRRFSGFGEAFNFVLIKALKTFGWKWIPLLPLSLFIINLRLNGNSVADLLANQGYCVITGSATIISTSCGNPILNSPVLGEHPASKKSSVLDIIPKNVPASVSSVKISEKSIAVGKSLLRKTQWAINDVPPDPICEGQSALPSRNDAAQPISNTRSTDIMEDSTKKASLGVDLWCFIFPEAVKEVPSTKSFGGVLLQGGSSLEWSDPKAGLGDPPKSSGSFPSLEAFSAKNDVPDDTGSDPMDPNLLKGSASSEFPMVNTPVANNGSAQILEGSSPAICIPYGSVKPVCAADLRRAVYPEVWARFPEAVWKDAAVIASEILNLPPPAGSARSPIPPIGQGMDPLIPPNTFSPDFVPPVAPVVKPVTPSDSSANNPDPEAPSFAALVTKKNVDVERIRSTDFSGPLPTAVFTKEECENVSAVYKNALIGKFSFGKPDNFAIANCLFNNGFGKCALQTIGSLIGTFLKADPMTINRARLDYARICVEVNLKNIPPKSVGISCGTIFKEFEVDYEKLPSFCHHCQHIGHSIDACYIKNPSLKPQIFTNKFLNKDNLQPKERNRSVWYTVGKGKKVYETSVSGAKNGESALKNKGSVNPEPEVNVFSAIPPHNLPPPFVLGDCNLSGACVVPVLFNLRSSGGDKKGSSNPETHRGSHQDSLNNLNDLVLSSSDDDTEQTDDKAHQDGAMSDPSFNASSNFSGAEGDPPDSGQSPHTHAIVFALPKISESSSIAGPAGKKGKSKKMLFGFDKVISNVNNHIWIFSDVGTDVSILFYSDQLLHTKVNCNDLPDHLLLSVVYGKNNKIERRILWHDLVSVSQNISPWMVGGDFNIVLYPHEKKGDNPPILSEMEEFRDAILECNLMDGGYVGPPFTWYSNFIWQRLDQVFSSAEWVNKFPRCCVKHIPRHTSDHNSLLCTFSSDVIKTKTSFRFQNMWVKHHLFLDTVRDSWSIPSPFSGLLKMYKKLPRLKLTLREWNKVTFGNIFQIVDLAQKKVGEAEERFDTDPNMANMVHLKKSNAELTLVLAMEESFWKQKAHVKWIMEGERNTKIFHDLVKKKRHNNQIHNIHVNGNIISNPTDIQESAVEYFSGLFDNESTNSDQFNHDLFSDTLLDCDNSYLCSQPTLDEVKDIVFDMEGDSVAGPDGFNAKFYQT
ncbi:hypothetical protein OROMI_007817 [Orobanche minor]